MIGGNVSTGRARDRSNTRKQQNFEKSQIRPEIGVSPFLPSMATPNVRIQRPYLLT